MIGVLNYGMGNIKSVSNAVYQLGFDPTYVCLPEDFQGLSHLIIPGVGAFDTAVSEIKKRELWNPILSFVESGKPLLGICLGMQLLLDRGEEGHGADGLGLIPGHVSKLPSQENLRIPHCGWNTAVFEQPHPVLCDVPNEVDYYFVHSYAVSVTDTQHLLASTEYGARFQSAVALGNVIGFQFHPEKSQSNGLKLLENFCEWEGNC